MRKQRQSKPAFPAPRPVHYAGYDFRSTLEARFAVFFDAAGIPWRYEPKWFNLPNGPYLPDFWLPRHQTWVEVKPRKTQIDAHKLSQLDSLGLLLTPDDLRIPDGPDGSDRHRMVDLCDDPEIVYGLCLVAPPDPRFDIVPYVVMEYHYFAECPKRCGGIGIVFQGRVHSCRRCGFDHDCARECIHLRECPVPESYDTPFLRSAFQKAQRYRF